MSVLDILIDKKLSPQADKEVCTFISSTILPNLAALDYKIRSAERLPLMPDTVPEDFFRICHYDLKEPATSALACDDEYLYLCIASRNGGIYKIGTGNGLTKAGKVYCYKQMSLAPEQVKMVIIGDTIYRSYQGCEFATVKTNNKHTLEPTGEIELNCPLIRSDSINLKINKYVPLMTDGKHLFAIFKSLDLEPLEEPPKKLAVPEPEITLKPPEISRPNPDEFLKAMERMGSLRQPGPPDGSFRPLDVEAKIQNLPFPSFMKGEFDPPEFLQKRISRKESKEAKGPMIQASSSLLQHPFLNQPPVPPRPAPIPANPSEPAPFFASENLELPQVPVPAPAPVPVPVPVPMQQDAVIIEIEPFLLNLIEAYFTVEVEALHEERWKKIREKRQPKLDKAANKNSPIRKPEDASNLQFNKTGIDRPPVAEAKKKKMPRTEKKSTTKAAQPAPEPEKDRHGVMNFWLYKYNLSHSLDEIKEEEYKDNPSVIELHESFSSLFSMKECARAFKLSQEDIILAAQWLIEEGEKQRNKKCINYEQVTLLAQGEIDPKCFKSKVPKQTPDEVTLTNSILNDRHLVDECLYYEGTILIGRNLYFSADPADEYELPDEILPQIMQDKKFITPERSKAVVQSYLKTKELFGRDRDDRADPSSLADMNSQMRHYYDNIINITKELSHLNSQDEEISMMAEKHKELLESKVQAMNMRMELDQSSSPELIPEAPKAKEQVKTEEKKEEIKKGKKLRGTFICKVGSALEKQEAFAPRCYDWKYNILYAVNMIKKHNWVQNPSVIVKSRDPICYPKVFDFFKKQQGENPRGKVFFDGTKEIEYGHSENNSSLIEDQKKFFEKHQSALSSLQSVSELRTLLNDLFILMNAKRFSLPYKTSNPIKALIKIQKDLDSQIKRMTNPEEKKSLQSKRAKITVKILKLEKLNRDTKSKEDSTTNKKEKKQKQADSSTKDDTKTPEAIINPTKFSESTLNIKKQPAQLKAVAQRGEIEENKRQYCFCSIGTKSELDTIFKKLKHSVEENVAERVKFYSQMLLFWSYHISVSITHEIAHELVEYLLKEIEEERLTADNLSIFGSIVVRMIYLINSESDIIQKILNLALRKKTQAPEVYDDIKERLSTLEFTQISRPNTSLLEKAYIILCRVKHYDVYHVFNQAEQSIVLNENSRVRQHDAKFKLNKTFGLAIKECDSISEVPESILFQLLMQLQESIMDTPSSTDLLLKWRIYYGHYFNLWTLLENKEREEKVHKLINEFVSITIGFVERYVEVIEKDNLKNIEVFGFILEYILCMINIATCYLINTKSSTKIMIDADFLATKNLKIMNTLMKVFKKVDGIAHGKLSSQLKLNNEGLDFNQQITFETSHPLNRGETAKTNVMSFPDALGVVVQLDKRCQSDSGKDFLQMYSWDSTQGPTPARSELNINSSSSSKLYMGIGFRVSGKLKGEDSFLLLGDSAKLVFEANPKCLDNDQSLKRWGYKMRSLPIYSYESTLLTSSEAKNSTPNNIVAGKYRVFGLLLIQLMSRLTVTLIREIDMFMKGRRVSIEEKRLTKYLQWTLMKSGLSSLRRDLFLQDQKQGLKLTQKMKDSVGRAIISTGNDEVSKGRSIEETEKMSQQSKGELEKEFLQDSQLSELLSRLQSDDSVLMELFSTIKGLQNVPQMLKMEKMRPTFMKELQRRWENSENMILLAMLHHSGLLKLLLSSSASKGQVANLLALDSVKDQLVAICAKKNEVLNKMIVELQAERELLQTLESMLEVLRQERDKIISDREAKAAEEEAQKIATKEDDQKKEEPTVDSKDNKKAKLEELQKKYSKKKVAKKSDHIKPKKDKDPKKNDKEKVETKKIEEEPEPDEEKKEPELKVEEQVKAPEVFFEGLLERQDVKDKLFSLLKDNRLSEANNIEFMMVSRNLIFQPDDIPANLQEVYSYLRGILLKSETEPGCIENPYVRISAKIDERCFFLLKIATHPNKVGEDKADIHEDDDKSYDIEGDGDDDLQPLDVTRSLSSTGPGFRKNSNRLEARMEGLEKRVDILGEWINSYKKWKASESTDQSVDSEKCSFLVSISTFLTQREPLDIKKLEKVLLRIAQRACFRAFGLDMIKDFLNFAHDTWLSKYLIGVFSAPFKYFFLILVEICSTTL